MVEQYLDIPYVILIVLVGNILTEKTKIKNYKSLKKWVILGWSTLLALLFMYADYQYSELTSDSMKKYLISYCVATSFYELIYKYAIGALKGVLNNGSIHREL
jgi:hypothetical protein